MKKKIILIISFILIFFIITIKYYNYKYETQECWWTILYPTFTTGFEEITPMEVSSLDKDFIPQRNQVQTKILIVEWLKKIFK